MNELTRRPVILRALRAVLAVSVLAWPLVHDAANAASLPRASHFLVHDKGFTASGSPNRDRSRLYVMQFTIRNGTPADVKVVKSYRTQYGLRDESKRREGDRNTPEGVYRITDMRRRRPGGVTGPWFFLMDYPNRHDRASNRTGSAIGIHGGPNRRTLGCIRLRDRERGGQGREAITGLRRYVEIGTRVVSMPYLPPWLKGTVGSALGAEAAERYAYLLTTPLTNRHAVEIVHDFAPGSTSYLATRDTEGPDEDLVTVSSELNPFGELTYRAHNLIDGDPRTCWSEGNRNAGVGEWVQVRFPEPRVVRRVKMVNGYAKGERWRQNNRVKRATIRLSDGTSFDWQVRDTDEWQEYVFPVALTTQFVEITIEDVYRGSRRDWNDASISELAVEAAAPGSASALGIQLVASASSVLAGGSASSGYHAYNAIDGDPSTAWSEGEDGTGAGEWLRVGFTRSRTITAVTMVNGYDKQRGRNDRWAQNPRVKRATLRFSDGSSQTWRLRDTREPQTIRLPSPVTTDYVQIVIEEAYPGSDWQDCSISEVSFEDAPAPPAPTQRPVRAEEPAAPATNRARASSSLDAGSSSNYAPGNVLDGDPATCWSEDARDASGQWLQIDFPREREVGRVRIVNGYDRVVGAQDRWSQNARVKDAVLRFDDGSEVPWRLRDTREWQAIELPEAKSTRSVRLTIRDVYAGSRWQDVSIGEIAFEAAARSTARIEPTPSRREPDAGTVASATSTLAGSEPGRFAASNVLDGDPETCWSEGIDGSGVGERLRIEFPAARSIRTIRTIAGYARGDLHARNSRPSRLTIALSDGTRYEWELRDTAEWQSFQLPQPVIVYFVEFAIEAEHAGSSWQDCSISEIRAE